jgi:hypothetical protein
MKLISERRETAKKLQNSLLFSLLAGNFKAGPVFNPAGGW